MRLKILLAILGILLLGSGVFLAKNTIFEPKPTEPPQFIGFESLEKEATESAKPKDKKNGENKTKEESGEEVKGTTTQSSPQNYKPTPKSQTTTKKVAEATKKVEEPPKATPLPDTSNHSPTQEYPFSESHLIGATNIINEINDVRTQTTSIYIQILDLEEKFYNVYEDMLQRTRGHPVTQSQLDKMVEAEQERIYNQIQLLIVDYNRLDLRLNQLYGQLCSTYYDVLVYYGYTDICR